MGLLRLVSEVFVPNTDREPQAIEDEVPFVYCHCFLSRHHLVLCSATLTSPCSASVQGRHIYDIKLRSPSSAHAHSLTPFGIHLLLVPTDDKYIKQAPLSTSHIRRLSYRGEIILQVQLHGNLYSTHLYYHTKITKRLQRTVRSVKHSKTCSPPSRVNL